MPSRLFYPQDPSGSIPEIDHTHHEIHEGHHFSTSYYEKIAGAGSAVNILITAPATAGVEYHFVAEFGVDGPGIFTLSKSPNATASGGTAITSINNNEISTETGTLTHVATPTWTSSGTIMATYVIGGSSGVGAFKVIVGGGGESRFEWIFAPSSVHLLRWVADLASCRTAIRTHYYKKA